MTCFDQLDVGKLSNGLRLWVYRPAALVTLLLMCGKPISYPTGKWNIIWREAPVIPPIIIINKPAPAKLPGDHKHMPTDARASPAKVTWVIWPAQQSQNQVASLQNWDLNKWWLFKAIKFGVVCYTVKANQKSSMTSMLPNEINTYLILILMISEVWHTVDCSGLPETFFSFGFNYTFFSWLLAHWSLLLALFPSPLHSL